jgi:hypothetical protein
LSRPIAVRIFGEQQKMFGLLGRQRVRFVTFLELHGFVSNPKRAHVQLSKIKITRRARRRDLRNNGDNRKECAHQVYCTILEKSPKTSAFGLS